MSREFPSHIPVATGEFLDENLLDRQGYSDGDFWLGRTFNGVPFGWREDVNLLTCAGPRSGKGVSSVVPNLMLYRGSTIIIDPKGELADLTADYRRRRLGQKVIVLDPVGVTTQVPEDLYGTYNPFAEMDPDSPHSVATAQSIANGIVVPKPDVPDDFFQKSAALFIQGVILYMLEHVAPENRTLLKLRQLVSAGDMDLYAEYMRHKREDDPAFPDDPEMPFRLLLARMFETETFDGIVREASVNTSRAGEKTMGSILATASTELGFLSEPHLKSVLSSSDDPDRTFTLDEFRRQDRKLTVYLCLPVDMISDQGRWMRIVIQQIIRYLERTQAQFDKNKHFPVMMMLDEFYQLGPMPAVLNTLPYAPGSGLRLWLILQDLNQLKENYPKGWESIISSCSLKQFFGVNDLTTAEYLAKLLGEREIMVPSVTVTETVTNTDGASQSRSQGRNEGTNQSESLTDSEGSSSGVTRGTNSSRTDSFGTSSGTSYGTSNSTNFSSGTSDGTNSSVGSSSGMSANYGASVNRRPSMGGGLDMMSNQGGSTSAGVTYNTGQSNSQGRSFSRNQNSGYGQSTNVGANFSTNRSTGYTEGTSESYSNSTNRSRSRGLSQGTSFGVSETYSQSRNISNAVGVTFGTTYNIQKRSVMTPDEILRSFTKDNLVQMVHIRGHGGMLLFRTPYFADPDLREDTERYLDLRDNRLLLSPSGEVISEEQDPS